MYYIFKQTTWRPVRHMDFEIRPVSVSRHRNGVNGMGFYLVVFDYYEPGCPSAKFRPRLMATVFDQSTPTDKTTAVINPNDPSLTYRGDRFDKVLRNVIRSANTCYARSQKAS